MNENITVGMNGFGRFGLNLLWWWFSDPEPQYRIAYINDETLTPEAMVHIIRTDLLVTGFRKCKVSSVGSTLLLQEPNGRIERIVLTCAPAEEILWLGQPQLFFECSGKRSVSAELCRMFLVGKTKTVIVSATCYDADATLVMGFNHDTFTRAQHRVVSYGSCTVNPGITLTSSLHDIYGIESCVVNVVHNVQGHRLSRGEGNTLQRKFCTLERMVPRLLPFLAGKFVVNYTVIPWTGVSMIDFAYRLKEKITVEDALRALKRLTDNGHRLYGLIGLTAADCGPEVHIGSRHSVVLVEENVRVVDDTLHLFGYFYNEGSGIRMHELANHIARQLT